ncbi:hypothetical protein BJ958_004322 [Nocardioides kongjuensis]|uniref:Uncharacterized protein n=1 Tax=Nocardioides kongjuensis TaxID=349522 RepID=A0A852RU79_9ACTN|nr:hypothetical protein [Nocardioides kongjuensis]
MSVGNDGAAVKFVRQRGSFRTGYFGGKDVKAGSTRLTAEFAGSL